MEKDPLKQVLKDLRRIRRQAHASIEKLPQPYPVQDALKSLDTALREAEDEILVTQSGITQWMMMSEEGRRNWSIYLKKLDRWGPKHIIDRMFPGG